MREAWGPRDRFSPCSWCCVFWLPPAPASAQDAGSCVKTEFEEVVDGAAAALRDLNNKNRPEFQEKLRQLKDKRGWDNDQFLKEAAPYVKDDQIDVYDETSNDLLGRITNMGAGGRERQDAGLRRPGTAARSHERARRHADAEVDLHVRQARQGAGALKAFRFGADAEP